MSNSWTFPSLAEEAPSFVTDHRPNSLGLSRFFPALSLQCFLPSLQVSEPALQPGLPEEAKATPLPSCPLLQFLLDSNLLVKPCYCFPSPSSY